MIVKPIAPPRVLPLPAPRRDSLDCVVVGDVVRVDLWGQQFGDRCSGMLTAQQASAAAAVLQRAAAVLMNRSR